MDGREISIQTSTKLTNARHNATEQTDGRKCTHSPPNNKREFKQQRQQRQEQLANTKRTKRIPSKQQYKYTAILYSRKPVCCTGRRAHAHSPSFTDKFIDYSCWIINLLLDVLVCSKAVYFYSLFVF